MNDGDVRLLWKATYTEADSSTAMDKVSFLVTSQNEEATSFHQLESLHQLEFMDEFQVM